MGGFEGVKGMVTMKELPKEEYLLKGHAACAVVAALRQRKMNDITVVGWAGDGGTADIGIQALSGAAERGTNFIYICYDNEAYGNTGMQGSGSNTKGAWTTTT